MKSIIWVRLFKWSLKPMLYFKSRHLCLQMLHFSSKTSLLFSPFFFLSSLFPFLARLIPFLRVCACAMYSHITVKNFTEYQNVWGWEASLKTIYSQSLLRARPTRALCFAYDWVLNILKNFTVSLDNLFLYLVTIIVNKCFWFCFCFWFLFFFLSLTGVLCASFFVHYLFYCWAQVRKA